ncbi:MAG: stage V sporulation protein AD [Longicatena sp.]
MTTINFEHVYVQARGTSGGPLEKAGPLGALLDKSYDNNYCGEDCFEKAERQLLGDAIDATLRKGNFKLSDIEMMIGGDLINQLTSSHYFMKDIDVPFIGVYGACSNSCLAIGQGAIYIEHQLVYTLLAFTSSHMGSAERQFRYPNEYGVQKKETTTITVTGAGALVLSQKKSKIKVTNFTIGKVIDWGHSDPNDMGIAMAPAAYDTLQTHFIDTKRSLKDYDLIVTGDLSKLGFAFLSDLLAQDGIRVHNTYHDCGMLIYDITSQDVFCGGSGCACSMIVTLASLLKQLEEGKNRRILVLATGALLSPVAIHQKGSIPCIAHAIVYERSDLL